MVQKLQNEEDAYLALIGGDEEGLDFFFNRYYSPLVYYATSFTRDSEAAREIAAEAFIKLWTKRETVAEWRKVRFLIYRIVHNAAVDFIREQERARKAISQLGAVAAAAERSALDRLIETETYHCLHLLLETLPAGSRQVFKMFYFQNKAIKEIAAELGISVNTVKTQKLRAIQTLRQYQGSFYFLIAYSLIFI